jgi:hypothetical protein
VLINSDDPIVLWQRTLTKKRNRWQISCVDIKDVNEVIITFEAKRGNDVFGDVALDDVELIDFCPRTVLYADQIQFILHIFSL